MPTKTVKKASKQTKDEVKRQQTKAPVTKVAVDDGGSYKIDHLTIMDNHEEPDTNLEPAEDIQARNNADLEFWGGSWCWNKSANSYGDKPEDSWFINPTPKLVGEMLTTVPLVFGSCEVALLDTHKDELEEQRKRFLDFMRSAHDGEIISEGLGYLKLYQKLFFESVQQYLGRRASYENQVNNTNLSDEIIEKAEMRKIEASAVCRSWAAKLIALVEAYHEVVSDERAYNLHFDFAPSPDSRDYGLYRWSVQNALNDIGRRLTRSVKDGKMDAEKYRIPRPWLETTQRNTKRDADTMLGDFI